MTTAFAPNVASALPTLPSGWPIGSYDTYEQAQRAVDYLADNEFPVQDVTIVGLEPMLVERVDSRLTWGRVLRRGAVSLSIMLLYEWSTETLHATSSMAFGDLRCEPI